MPMPKIEGSMVLTAISNLMGPILFGMTVVKIVGETYCNSGTLEPRTA